MSLYGCSRSEKGSAMLDSSSLLSSNTRYDTASPVRMCLREGLDIRALSLPLDVCATAFGHEHMCAFVWKEGKGIADCSQKYTVKCNSMARK